MKICFILCLFLFPCLCFGNDYVFEYRSFPEKIDCQIKFDSHFEINNNLYDSKNIIDFSSGKINEGKFSAVFTNKKAYKDEKKSCDYSLKLLKDRLVTENHSGTALFPETGMTDSVLTSQFILPDRPVKVGDRWHNFIKNPVSDRDVEISARLDRVADNLATVSFSFRSPFSDVHISDMKQLMAQKLEQGSTFWLRMEKYFGHAEISGSGFWDFDIEKGTLAYSEQNYRFTTLALDRKVDVENFDEYIYMDVNLKIIYNFR